MREIVHIQAGQCGNQIGAKVCFTAFVFIGLASFLDGETLWRTGSAAACGLGVDFALFIHSVNVNFKCHVRDIS